MLDIVWDMETSDPDDFITLLLLLGHPMVNLKAVTITPGTPDQVGLVRRALSWFGREHLPIGAFDLSHPKDCVSAWHHRVYGREPPSWDAEPGPAVLLRECDDATILVTGAPLKNLGAAVTQSGFRLGCWVAQGGFAGANLVPEERQLPAFKGRLTCPSYNLDGARQAAQAALAAPNIAERYFISKNVCHGVVYDADLHAIVGELKDCSLSLQLIHRGMEAYLKKNAAGKKLHDPLAACCAIDHSIGVWAAVELFRGKGGWGAEPSPGSSTHIITDYKRKRFIEVLTAHAGSARSGGIQP